MSHNKLHMYCLETLRRKIRKIPDEIARQTSKRPFFIELLICFFFLFVFLIVGNVEIPKHVSYTSEPYFICMRTIFREIEAAHEIHVNIDNAHRIVRYLSNPIACDKRNKFHRWSARATTDLAHAQKLFVSSRSCHAGTPLVRRLCTVRLYFMANISSWLSSIGFYCYWYIIRDGMCASME